MSNSTLSLDMHDLAILFFSLTLLFLLTKAMNGQCLQTVSWRRTRDISDVTTIHPIRRQSPKTVAWHHVL